MSSSCTINSVIHLTRRWTTHGYFDSYTLDLLDFIYALHKAVLRSKIHPKPNLYETVQVNVVRSRGGEWSEILQIESLPLSEFGEFLAFSSQKKKKGNDRRTAS